MLFLYIKILKMKKILLILALSIGFVGFAQNATLSGTIKDGENGNEPLTFASVMVKELGQTFYTDELGNYSIALEPGNYTLIVDFIGYQPIEIKSLEIKSDVVKDGVIYARKFNSADLASLEE